MDVFHYWLFAPARGGFVDDAAHEPAFETLVHWEGKSYLWSVFVDELHHPLAARLLVEGAEKEPLSAELEPLATLLSEHILAVVRMAWDASASFLPMRFAVRKHDQGGMNVRLGWPALPPLDPQKVQSLFEHAMPLRELFRLYSDGTNELIPPQFRFLSLYKLLEAEFRDEHGHWDNGALSRALAVRSAEYFALGLPREFAQELHDMRDRCAHIRTGRGKKRRIGVTSLSHGSAVEVGRLLPLLRAICAAVINGRAEGKFNIALDQPEVGFVTEAAQLPTG